MSAASTPPRPDDRGASAPRRSPRVTGSRFGQDRWVLDVCGGMRDGFFLDTGAGDGVHGSNTVLLERDRGWDGICVEPDPARFAALATHRRCRCVNARAADRDDDALPPATAPRPPRALRGLLAQLGAPRAIDYWSVATGGGELALLEAFPWDAHQVQAITVAHRWQPARALIHAALTLRGYRRVATLGHDDGYVLGVAGPAPTGRAGGRRRG